ncbi:MAG: uncharacterized protein JWM52_54 [Candidatus Saccharibacteria bacterium]|nr:uncharacterized protein [Candidatus Saccharibacteria bacterium]
MNERIRRAIIAVLSLVVLAVIVFQTSPPDTTIINPPSAIPSGSGMASTTLETLVVKGRAATTGYTRDQFGSGWSTVDGCDTRNIILNRDLQNPVLDEECRVVSGTLNDVYTAKVINFTKEDSSTIQIDHVIALSDAWQKGAQQLTRQMRVQLANDPLELIAVDGASNQEKGDGDAATWLPSNISFRCQYVARQIAVKQKYTLWVTGAEKQAMKDILNTCPKQDLPTP